MRKSVEAAQGSSGSVGSRSNAARRAWETRKRKEAESKALSPKVASPRSRAEAAIKAYATRRFRRAKRLADKSEQESKQALSRWCEANGWKRIFFEGPTGAPRNGIVDAVIARIKPGLPDCIEVRLVQLKSGSGGLTGLEIKRMKAAAANLDRDWLLAAFDGETLHFVPDIPLRGDPKLK